MSKEKETKFEAQIANVQPESQSSIEIKQTTKGVTFTVKVYDADATTAQRVAESLFNDLAKKYSQGDKL